MAELSNRIQGSGLMSTPLSSSSTCKSGPAMEALSLYLEQHDTQSVAASVVSPSRSYTSYSEELNRVITSEPDLPSTLRSSFPTRFKESPKLREFDSNLTSSAVGSSLPTARSDDPPALLNIDSILFASVPQSSTLSQPDSVSNRSDSHLSAESRPPSQPSDHFQTLFSARNSPQSSRNSSKSNPACGDSGRRRSDSLSKPWDRRSRNEESDGGSVRNISDIMRSVSSSSSGEENSRMEVSCHPINGPDRTLESPSSNTISGKNRVHDHAARLGTCGTKTGSRARKLDFEAMARSTEEQSSSKTSRANEETDTASAVLSRESRAFGSISQLSDGGASLKIGDADVSNRRAELYTPGAELATSSKSNSSGGSDRVARSLRLRDDIGKSELIDSAVDRLDKRLEELFGEKTGRRIARKSREKGAQGSGPKSKDSWDVALSAEKNTTNRMQTAKDTPAVVTSVVEAWVSAQAAEGFNSRTGENDSHAGENHDSPGKLSLDSYDTPTALDPKLGEESNAASDLCSRADKEASASVSCEKDSQFEAEIVRIVGPPKSVSLRASTRYADSHAQSPPSASTEGNRSSVDVQKNGAHKSNSIALVQTRGEPSDQSDPVMRSPSTDGKDSSIGCRSGALFVAASNETAISDSLESSFINAKSTMAQERTSVDVRKNGARASNSLALVQTGGEPSNKSDSAVTTPSTDGKDSSVGCHTVDLFGSVSNETAVSGSLESSFLAVRTVDTSMTDITNASERSDMISTPSTSSDTSKAKKTRRKVRRTSGSETLEILSTSSTPKIKRSSKDKENRTNSRVQISSSSDLSAISKPPQTRVAGKSHKSGTSTLKPSMVSSRSSLASEVDTKRPCSIAPQVDHSKQNKQEICRRPNPLEALKAELKAGLELCATKKPIPRREREQTDMRSKRDDFSRRRTNKDGSNLGSRVGSKAYNRRLHRGRGSCSSEDYDESCESGSSAKKTRLRKKKVASGLKKKSTRGSRFACGSDSERTPGESYYFGGAFSDSDVKPKQKSRIFESNGKITSLSKIVKEFLKTSDDLTANERKEAPSSELVELRHQVLSLQQRLETVLPSGVSKRDVRAEDSTTADLHRTLSLDHANNPSNAVPHSIPSSGPAPPAYHGHNSPPTIPGMAANPVQNPCPMSHSTVPVSTHSLPPTHPSVATSFPQGICPEPSAAYGNHHHHHQYHQQQPRGAYHSSVPNFEVPPGVSLRHDPRVEYFYQTISPGSLQVPQVPFQTVSNPPVAPRRSSGETANQSGIDAATIRSMYPELFLPVYTQLPQPLACLNPGASAAGVPSWNQYASDLAGENSLGVQPVQQLPQVSYREEIKEGRHVGLGRPKLENVWTSVSPSCVRTKAGEDLLSGFSAHYPVQDSSLPECKLSQQSSAMSSQSVAQMTPAFNGVSEYNATFGQSAADGNRADVYSARQTKEYPGRTGAYSQASGQLVQNHLRVEQFPQHMDHSSKAHSTGYSPRTDKSVDNRSQEDLDARLVLYSSVKGQEGDSRKAAQQPSYDKFESTSNTSLVSNSVSAVAELSPKMHKTAPSSSEGIALSHGQNPPEPTSQRNTLHSSKTASSIILNTGHGSSHDRLGHFAQNTATSSTPQKDTTNDSARKYEEWKIARDRNSSEFKVDTGTSGKCVGPDVLTGSGTSGSDNALSIWLKQNSGPVSAKTTSIDVSKKSVISQGLLSKPQEPTKRHADVCRLSPVPETNEF